jgi:quinol monooxygenase YgiN
MKTSPREAAEMIRAFRSFKPAIQSVRGLAASHLYLDAEAADSICYIEEWQTPEDLGQTAAVEHFTRLFELMERSSEVPVLCVNSVTNSRGMDHLSTLMRDGETGIVKPEAKRGTGEPSGRPSGAKEAGESP